MTDEAAWVEPFRAELPVLQHCVYLNTGTAGPLPVPTAEAIARVAATERVEGRGDFSRFGPFLETRRRARELVARLLGADAEQIALTHHTSDGINIVLWGIPWRPGDVLVTTTLEHDAGVVPISVLRERFGVEVRFAEVGRGERALAAVQEALSPSTRLVLLSHVAYSTGAVLPVSELVQAAHAVGAAVLVDGAQSCGAMPVDVRAIDADYYTVSGQKWLCGPEGTGALYVRADRLDELRPTFTSYFSAADHDFRGTVVLHQAARRFETGMVYRPALSGFVASLEWLLDQVGIERAWQRSRALAELLRRQLAALDGVQIITPAAQASGLLSFDLPAFSPARLNALAQRWAREDRLVVRSVDHPPYALRASLGFFNDERDAARLVEAVAAALERGPQAVSPADAWRPLPDQRP